MILLDKVKPCEAFFHENTTLITVLIAAIVVLLLCIMFVIRYRKSKQQ